MVAYFLKVTICWVVFYLIYVAFLRKETFFRVNRWYLLSTMLLGAIIPLVEFLPEAAADDSAMAYFQMLNEGVFYAQSAVSEAVTESSFSWGNLLWGIYFTGVAIFGIRMLIGLGKIFQLYRSSEIIKKENHTLVITKQLHLPFTFFNLLFWSENMKLNDTDGEKILSHEQAHVRGWHSVDVLLCEILSIIFWCSPMIYFYKKSIKTVHEYLADAVVLQTTPTKKYGHLLLKQSQSGLQVALANHFIHSQLKQRIIMMTRSKSRKEAAIKYLFALPVILLLFIIFSRKQAIANIDEPVTEFEVILDKNEVDELPLFVGCEDISDKAERRECSNKKLLTYIYTSIKYPKEARLAGIQGKVYIKYVVGKNGMIKDARVVKSIGGGCDEAALKVVNSIPKMIPGTKDGKAVDVEMTLPVMFKLEGDDVPAPKKEETVETPKNKLEDITVVGFSPQKKSAEEEIFKIVEEMPRFPGCEEITNNKDKRQTCADENLMKFIYGNIRYPKAAREKGIQGKAYAQFVIQKDGTVTDVKIVKDQQGQFGDEVLRVVSMMPKWIPGKQRGKVVAVRYTLPVMFKLEGEAKKEKTTPNKNNPLIVIDGEIFKGENVSLEKINPEQIETIYVLKGEKAIEKYGDQGKDGVIEITMKEGADFNSLSEESKESIDLEKEEKNVGKQKEEKRHTKKDLGIESLKISPNPTSGIINIEFEADELLMEVIVYDMYGQELYRTKTYGGHRTLPDIDVSKAPKGNVLVAFKKGKKVYTEIIVVQ